MTTTNEQSEGPDAKPGNKGRRGAQRGNVAAKKAKPGNTATSKQKAFKREKTAEVARGGSKAAQILQLLKRPEGASLNELMKALEWQAHSVRGFLSGTLRKKMGLTVTSSKAEEAERRYSISA